MAPVSPQIPVSALQLHILTAQELQVVFQSISASVGTVHGMEVYQAPMAQDIYAP